MRCTCGETATLLFRERFLTSMRRRSAATTICTRAMARTTMSASGPSTVMAVVLVAGSGSPTWMRQPVTACSTRMEAPPLPMMAPRARSGTTVVAAGRGAGGAPGSGRASCLT